MALHTHVANNPSRELNWLDLPNHVLLLITDKLISQIKDYIRFGAVCQSWRSVYTRNLQWYRTHLPRQLPLLMLYTNNDVKDSIVYSLTENQICKFPFVVLDDENICGSTQGWLVTVFNSDVRLSNPWLTVNNEIELPSISAIDPASTFEDQVYVEKVVLSANPISNSDYIVMAIYGGYNRLAYFKPGQNNWISFYTYFDMFEDVIYYQDQFYAINFSGDVFICDINPSNPMVSKFVEKPSEHTYANRRYLVESNGALLQILMIKEDADYSTGSFFTVEFTVLRLDLVKLNWIEAKNLSGQMLFIGKNSSMSLFASDFPGCKPDSIYFTYDSNEGDYMKPDGSYDMGVFSMEVGRLELYYPKVTSEFFLPPVWVQPTL